MLSVCSAPEDAGIPSGAVSALLDAFEQRGLEPHAVMIVKDNKVAAALQWAPYDAYTPHTLFSLSKSFCSCAAGFAVAEGLLRYEDSIVDLLPDKAPAHSSDALRAITIGDLLCMGSGMAEESDQVPDGCEDVARYFLSCPVKYPPRSHFHYNTMGTYMVSCAVQRVTGQTCRDYLTPRVFNKLGIRPPQWDCCPMGINYGGFGLHLSCEDIAKFGQLLLNRGCWMGERVLPEGWVELATGYQISNAAREGHDDWKQGYGYQFWRTRGGRYRGDGMHGQVCMVDDAHGTAVAVVAGIRDMGKEMDALDVFFRALDGAPASKEEQAALRRRVAGLGYAFPKDDRSGAIESDTYGDGKGAYVRLENNGDGTLCAFVTQPGFPQTMPLRFGVGKPLACDLVTGVPGEQPRRALAACGWNAGELHCVLRALDGPYTIKLSFKPSDGGAKARIALDCVGPASGVYDMVRRR